MINEELPIGTKSGCLTIIGELGNYQEEAKKELFQYDDKTRKQILACRRVHHSQIKTRLLLRIQSLGPGLKYKCQCKYGQIHYLSKIFFESKNIKIVELAVD